MHPAMSGRAQRNARRNNRKFDMTGEPNPKTPEDDAANDRKRQLNTLIGLSDKFGDSLANAFAKNVAEGKKFDGVLKSIRQSLVENGLRLSIAPLQSAFSQSVKSVSTAGLGSAPLDLGGWQAD